MTRVCFLGAEDVQLRYELLSSETARAALASYDLEEPWENTVAVRTVSLGAAIALVNDLNWYAVRYMRDVLLQDPSVSEREWLSDGTARRIREQDWSPDETGDLLKIYGVEENRLVEPMYVQRTDDASPTYDLRDVDGTVPVRITEEEFG